MSTKLLSVICPVYNEETTIPLFYQRIVPVLRALEGKYRWELIFTNNCSSDKTLDVIREIRQQDNSVFVVTFSRNFGYQASILAGLSMARGDILAVVDVDCEDPPEMIAQFVEKYEEGYDVVYGIRGNRPEPKAVVLLRKAFYRVLRTVADFDVIVDMAEFSLMAARVRDYIVANSNTFPFVRAEIAYCGFRRFGIPYNRQQRIAGKSHYNLFTMLLFGVAGILTTSTFAFRFATYFLPALLVANVFSALLLLFNAGWKLFCILLLFNTSYAIIILTLSGLYLARIYKNGISRPVYIVDHSKTYL